MYSTPLSLCTYFYPIFYVQYLNAELLKRTVAYPTGEGPAQTHPKYRIGIRAPSLPKNNPTEARQLPSPPDYVDT